jgi:hypothetical protein
MDVGLAGVLVVEVPVRHMRMVQRSVVVLVLVRRTQVLETSCHLAVVVSDVKVPMSVYEPLVVVFLPVGYRWLFGHRSLLRADADTLVTTARPTSCSVGGPYGLNQVASSAGTAVRCSSRSSSLPADPSSSPSS